MEQTIQQAEKEWHEAHFVARRGRALVVSDAVRRRYLDPPSRPQFHLEQVFQSLGDVRGKRILYYGCGDDTSTVLLALKGAEVFAFDLSEQAIRLQREMAEANGVADRIHLLVCAAEEFPFRKETFDIVVGIAILHHIPNHLTEVPRQVASVLRTGGRAVFTEPMIRSRMLGWILRQLPFHDKISPGERQLTNEDLGHFERFFESRPVFFCVLSRLDRFLCPKALEGAPAVRRFLVRGVHAFDHLILQLPFMDRLAAIVVLDLTRRPNVALES
jgi:2-polyprenyl-3-methyl-5-hydroxy-6-metoxy-1,4-benzoquinol methylase